MSQSHICWIRHLQTHPVWRKLEVAPRLFSPRIERGVFQGIPGLQFKAMQVNPALNFKLIVIFTRRTGIPEVVVGERISGCLGT